MSEETILLIDDSATIRRLVDTELSSAGYRTLLAPTAEEGLERAANDSPDLIILDHQLPGTTGFEVCCQLLDDPVTAKIPVVASSTLRKKAYSEYVDCDNVVDMLPKPYTPEVLIATVKNAIDTAAMVVQSQQAGSAVPEVISGQGDADLSGTFKSFSLREVIDLLNNGGKCGVLEINTEEFRVYVYTDKGRIQAITASGISPDTIAARMPENLSELAPLVKFTLSGKKGTEIDGLVDLLDNKVLDPRLLKKLLRLQAATLLTTCFTGQPTSFRFEHNQVAPSLFRKLPLDISLVGLLVEGAMIESNDAFPSVDPSVGFVRQAIRGQNLDRSGLTSKHIQLMKSLSEPVSLAQIATRLQWSEDETQRVLRGFEMADLVQRALVQQKRVVFSVISDTELRMRVSQVAKSVSQQVSFKAVSDLLALGLLARRQTPDCVVVEVTDHAQAEKFQAMKSKPDSPLNDATLIAIPSRGCEVSAEDLARQGFDFAVSAETDGPQLLSLIMGESDQSTGSDASPGDATSATDCNVSVPTGGF